MQNLIHTTSALKIEEKALVRVYNMLNLLNDTTDTIVEAVENSITNGLNLSHATGLVASIVSSELNLPSDYWTEKSVVVFITNYLLETPLLKWEVSFETTGVTYRSVCQYQESVEALSTKDKIHRMIPTKTSTSMKFKGHRLLGIKVPKHLAECSDTEYRIEVQDRMYDLHAYLKAMKDVVNSKEGVNSIYARYMLEAKMANKLAIASQKTPLVMYTKCDTRGRKNPLLNFGAISIYGNHFQSRTIRSATPYVITNSKVNEAKWILAVELLPSGRVPQEIGVKLFDDNINDIHQQVIDMAKSIEYSQKLHGAYQLMKDGKMSFEKYKGLKAKYLITPNDLGDYLYMIEVFEYTQSVGELTTLLLEFDMTNSGLIHLASSHGNLKMQTLANLVDKNKVHDSHNAMLEALLYVLKTYFKDDAIAMSIIEAFSRNDVKGIQVSLLHGGGVRSMLKALFGDKLDDISNAEEILVQALDHCYGKDVWRIPNMIAEWFRAIHVNHSVITWEMSDGFPASSTSYIQAGRIEVPLMSPIHNGVKHVETAVISAILPNFGTKHIRVSNAEDATVKSVLKTMGGYAAIQHARDAMWMRKLYMIDRFNNKFVDILDKVKLQDISINDIMEEGHSVLLDMSDETQLILDQVADKYEVERLILPKADLSAIQECTYNYMSA